MSEKLSNFYKNSQEEEKLLNTKMDKADFLAYTGKVEEGLKIYQKILANKASFYLILLRLANFYLNNDMIDKSVSTLKKIIYSEREIDDNIFADAISDLVYLIDEFGLEEDSENYRKLAEEKGIIIFEELEVLISPEKVEN